MKVKYLLIAALAFCLCGGAYAADFSIMSNVGPANAAPIGDKAAPRQGGDTIATATVIPAVPYTDTGTTVGYVNDYDETCPFSGGTAPDVVYAFTPAVNQTVTIDLCASGYDTKVYVYENAYTPGVPYACDDDGCGASYRSILSNLVLTGGNTYYIVVDGYGTSSGSYTMNITGPCVVECPVGGIPEGEVDCYDEYVDITNGGCNSVPPVFGVMNDGDTICGKSGTYLYTGLNYRDTDWYALTTTEGNTITLTGIAEFPLQLLIITETGPACDGVYGATYAATAGACNVATVSQVLPAGTYYLWVGPSVFTGVACGSDWFATLDVEPTSVPVCGDVEVDLGTISCPADVMVTGTTVGAANFCGNAAPDAFYSFTVPAESDYTISLCYAATTYDTYLRLYNDACCGTLIASNDDFCGLQSQITAHLTPGTYHVQVEGYSSASGPYELHITCSGGSVRPCPDCEPEDIDLGYIGTTVWGYNVSGDCGNGGKWVGQFNGEAGRIYHFDLCGDAPGAGTTNFDSDIKITNSACGILTGVDGSCATLAWNANDFQWICPADGTYYAIIAPYSSYASHTCTGTAAQTFTMEYYKEEPSLCEGKDICADALDVSPGGTFLGNNSGCTNDYSVYTGCIPWSMVGADQVYKIEIPCPGYEICATVTPIDFWDPGIAMAFECSDGTIACLAGSDAGFEGDPETVCFQASNGQTGTLYIFVDSYYAPGTTYADGNYQLDVTLTTFAANDTCATAIDISAGGTFAGDTCCGVNDYAGYCGFGWGTPGKDLAYAFTIPDATHMELAVLPGTLWDPAVYIVGDCGDIVGTCVAGADDGFEGDLEYLSLDFPCGGTYYVIVDSYYADGAASCGPFDLQVAFTSNPPADTFDVDIQCPTGTVTLPGSAMMKVIMTSTSPFSRMICGQVDVTLCQGQVIQHIRSGYTVLSPAEVAFIGWRQKIPALNATCNCGIVFTVNAEDCTPCENNNMIPAGWAETDSCVVNTYCP